MRILHIVDHWGLGGAQRMLATLLRHDAAIDHRIVALFSHGKGHWALPEGKIVHFLGQSYASLPWLAWRLRAHIRRVQPEMIHVHLTGSRFLTGAAMVGWGKRRPVVLWHEHSGIETRQRYGTLLGSCLIAAQRFLARGVAGLSVGSRVLRPFCREALGVAEAGITVLPCPVSSADIRAGLSNAGSGESPRGAILGFVGRLAAQKQPHLFLEVARHCLDHNLVDEVWLVGDGPLRTELDAKVRGWGLESRIRFWGTRDDVYPLMNQVRVLVMPSAYEPFGIVAVEAFVLGKPVVGFAVDGLAEVLDASNLGHAVPAGDKQALLQKVVSLLNDRENATQELQGENPYEATHVIRDWQAFYRQFEADRPR